MPFVRGFLRIITHDRWGRPVDPGYGIPEGGRPDQGLPPGEGPVDPDWGIEEGGRPTHPIAPGWPVRPGQPLPPSFPGRPGQGLPWPGRPVDPGWGIDEIPGLPGIPGQLPIFPGRPGHPLPRPPVPVVSTVPLPEGEELPAGAPHEPGCICVVVEAKSHKRALGWLQGESNLPEVEPTTSVPAPGRGGHWVAVDADPMTHFCRESDAAVSYAFVFEIDGNFGKPPVAKPK